MEPTEPQIQAGRAWLNLKTKTRAETQAKILKFLRLNPDSDSSEIREACQASQDIASRFLKHGKRKIDGRTVYRVDELKFARFFA